MNRIALTPTEVGIALLFAMTAALSFGLMCNSVASGFFLISLLMFGLVVFVEVK